MGKQGLTAIAFSGLKNRPELIQQTNYPSSMSIPTGGILGIEGGGTKTEWLFEEASGLPRRAGVLPGANLRLISDRALRRLLEALPREASQVGVFLAGCATPSDRERLLGVARSVWPEAELRVGSDRESGFIAALGERDGVVVIAGTGSAITGRHGVHEERAGGWGQLLGDTGSGYDLAVQALRRVLWNYDVTRATSPTAQAILFALGLNRLEELISWAEQADKMSVAQLAPVVFQAAQEGDEEMQRVVQKGAEALADAAVSVAERLDLSAPEVRLQGGIFTHFPGYVDQFSARMREQLPKARIEVSVVSGAEGALRLAAGRPLPTSPPALEVDEGGAQELDAAATEQVNPRSIGLDRMGTGEIVDLFVAEEAFVAEALHGAREAIVRAIDQTAEAMKAGGRLFYVGAGTSGRLGVLDASEIPPTFGVEPERVQGVIAGGASALYRAGEGAEDHPEGGALAMEERGVTAGDVVCGIAASGRTPFVLGALARARQLGATTILLTCNPSRRPSPEPWDVEIDLATGPELLMGSTRLKAGTATKCTLNLLSTAVMTRLGRVHDNLMAGVSVSNAKLRDRAIRLVCMLRGLSRSEAEAELERCDWEVRRLLP